MINCLEKPFENMYEHMKQIIDQNVHVSTVLSRIVVPLIFSTKKYVMICSKFTFCHLKQHNFINGTQNMQFHNII